MDRKPVKYYTPGLISLFLLPMLTCFYAAEAVMHKKQYAMQINIPRKGAQHQFNFAGARNYLPVEITGSKISDYAETQRLVKLVRTIVKQHDTLNGLCIHFGPRSSGQSLITVIDICQVEKLPLYTWQAEDYFWIVPVTGN